MLLTSLCLLIRYGNDNYGKFRFSRKCFINNDVEGPVDISMIIKYTQRRMLYSGRRLRTKDDLHLWNYRADIQVWACNITQKLGGCIAAVHSLFTFSIFSPPFHLPPSSPPLPSHLQQWIQELEVAFEQVESSEPKPSPSYKDRFRQSAEVVLTYLLE